MSTAAQTSLAARYDVQETIDYIIEGGYRGAALQFPDDQLADSPGVYQLLQQALGDRSKVFILADTAYNPLGVDEVAAQHLAAQCVIHYGRAALVPVNCLPAFFVLPKEPLDVAVAAAAVRQAVDAEVQAKWAQSNVGAAAGATDVEHSGNGGEVGGGGGGSVAAGYRAVVVLVDQAYQYRLRELRAALEADVGGGSSSGGDGQLTAPRPPLIFAEVIARSLHPSQPPTKTPAPAAAAAAPRAATGSGGCCAVPGSCGAGQGGADRGSPHVQQEGGEGRHQADQQQQEQQSQQACQQPQAAQQPCLSPAAGGCLLPPGGCCAESSAADANAATAVASSTGAGAGAGAGVGTGAWEPATGAGTGAETAAVDKTSSCTSCNQADRAAGDPTAGRGPGRDGEDPSPSTSTSNPTTSMAGLRWSLPAGVSRRDCLYVWVGPEGGSAQQVLQMTHSTCDWLSYDPAASAEGTGAAVRRGLADETRRLLKRRNFLVEKARAANIVGILVGTLGSAGFLDVISALRRMVAAAGKKSYTFLMGKPNPAKLGNFPEVDVFVLVADAQGLILDCRDYLAPIVTPWEAALALGGRHIDPDDYRLELRDVLEYERQQQQAREAGQGGEADDSALAVLGAGLSLATRGSGGDPRHEIVARNAAEYLALKRSYKGLEMPETGASPKAAQLAVEGLSGRAAVYAAEGSSGSGATDAAHGASATAW